jgi:adenosine deaminase
MSPTSYRTAPPRDVVNPYTTHKVAALLLPWSQAAARGSAEKSWGMPIAQAVPKVHLHCHLEGALRAATFVELAAEHGVPLRYHPSGKQQEAWTDEPTEPVDPKNPYRFKDFPEFLLMFAAVSRSLQTPGDYARLGREFVEDALAQNVMYGELFVSPSVWTFFNPGLDVRACFEALVHELRAARPRATFKLLPDLTRNFGEASAMGTAKLAVSFADLDVIGVSLGGDEARFPPELFVEAFEFVRSQGMHTVAHAGEAAGAESVRVAVEVLGAQRIGHGIHALRDRSVVELLARRQIPLEICPTSNILTGAALPDYPHPYVDLDRAGCVVTIDADDPTLFGTSIEREYTLVEQVVGSNTLTRFVRNAIDASFASDEHKAAMHSRLGAELEALRRSWTDNVRA